MRNLEDNTKSSRFFYLIIKMYLCIIKITDALEVETSNFKIIDSIENMNVLFDSADHI